MKKLKDIEKKFDIEFGVKNLKTGDYIIAGPAAFDAGKVKQFYRQAIIELLDGVVGNDRENTECECLGETKCGCWVDDYNQRGKDIRENIKKVLE